MLIKKDWYKGGKYETMVEHMKAEGVEIIYYYDPHTPHKDSFPVFNQKAFFDVLEILYNAEAMALPQNTYIELYTAWRKWLEVVDPDNADAIIEAEEDKQYHALKTVLSAVLA